MVSAMHLKAVCKPKWNSSQREHKPSLRETVQPRRAGMTGIDIKWAGQEGSAFRRDQGLQDKRTGQCRRELPPEDGRKATSWMLIAVSPPRKRGRWKRSRRRRLHPGHSMLIASCILKCCPSYPKIRGVLLRFPPCVLPVSGDGEFLCSADPLITVTALEDTEDNVKVEWLCVKANSSSGTFGSSLKSV